MYKKIERISDRERFYVNQVLDGQFRNHNSGRVIQKLEREFAKLFQSHYALALVNGTATLHTALKAIGVGPGDEVIVPPLTMASTTFAVVHAGAVPVYVDVEENTFNIDPLKIEACLTSKTKAIIPVALFGMPPDMDPIMDIARRYHLKVVEDSAQCFLGRYKGKVIGSIGDVGSFSFQISKHITCGEGGMVVTNNEELAEKMRRFSMLGYKAVSADPARGKVKKDQIQDPSYERHSEIGWNYRMPEICAAVALGQVERLEEFVQRRIQVAKLYNEVVKDCEWLVPQYTPEHCKHSYWTYAVRLENKNILWKDFYNKYLELGGDGIYSAWKPNYLEPALFRKKILKNQTFDIGLCPVAESLQTKLLQFKTNYLDLDVAMQKTEALEKTIHFFNG